MLKRIRAAGPSLFVVDEAHCISEWGHDFRPDYLRLGAVIEELGHPTTLALTATAAPPVREEICGRLRLRGARVVLGTLDRPNIRFAVDLFHDADRRDEALLERVEGAPKPGIVYVGTRNGSEELAAALCERGMCAAAYHGGMSPRQRRETQAAFMEDELAVIVATTAFAMGVDKPNVRFVFHREPSDSVDSSYQEIGRCGRDGEPAEAILFFRSDDLELRRFVAGTGRVGSAEIERVARTLATHGADEGLSPAALGERTELSKAKVQSAVNRLEDAGAVTVRPGGEVARAPGRPDPRGERAPGGAGPGALRGAGALPPRDAALPRRAALRLQREFLLNYFGEPYEDPARAATTAKRVA